jgi:iron complex outermembrane receptor protein
LQIYCNKIPALGKTGKMKTHAPLSLARSVLIAAYALPAHVPAQELAASNAAVQMETVVITAGPLQRSLFEQTQPVNIVEGEELRLRLQSTLGETLSQQAGVSSSYYGPASSRPVIRGLSDDRVQILSNGNPNVDLSNLSADHAVTIDPLTIERVEVIRGPATLLYGPQSIGGVVNVTDSRIASKKLELNALGQPIRGAFEGRYNSVDNSGAGSGVVKFGLGPVVIHLDGFRRNATDLRIPGESHTPFARQNADTPSVRNRLLNSASESDGGALGASTVWDEGFFGISYSGFNTRYGAVGERDVVIDMTQRRWDSRGAFRNPVPGIKSVEYKFSATEYQHRELKDSIAENDFRSNGYMGRLEISHEKWGLFEGALGYQAQLVDVDSTSEHLDHLLLPPVRSRTHSLFFLEEAKANLLTYQFGGRVDLTGYETDALAGSSFTNSQSRDFAAWSTSGGVVYEFVKNYALAFNAALTQRPPTGAELFSNGAHHATGTFETGDANLGLERSLSLDLSLRKKQGRVTANTSVFYNRFSRFLGLFPTGANVNVDGEDLAEYRFRGTRAQFWGAEAELVFHLFEHRSHSDKGGKQAEVAEDSFQGLHLDLRSDYVRSREESTGRSLPRIPPMRHQAALAYDWQNFHSRVETQYVARQNRTSENERPTESYYLLNASVSYRIKEGPTEWNLYVRGANLTNQEARMHTSFLKEVAPLPGRSITAGLRIDF